AAPGQPERQRQEQIGDRHRPKAEAAELLDVDPLVPQGRPAIAVAARAEPRRQLDGAPDGGGVAVEVAAVVRPQVRGHGARVAHLLERGVQPRHVLAVSFTNKAADEMVDRVERLVGSRQAKELTLSTFHSLGMNLLKIERKALGFPSGFTIYDASDQLGLVR